MRGTWLALGTALAIGAAGPALAHGPVRQKITESVEINAPAAKVWSVIGNFQDMSWHPAVEKTEGTGGNEPDTAKRTLTLKGGGVLNEELARYQPEEFSYSYRIPQVDVKVLPVNNYSSTIIVIPEGPDKSKVEWRGAYYRGYPNNDPPPELNEEAANKAVSGVYRAGLDALKARVEAGS
jgi:Polyketide cyclase / dehydrase and lipid transport